MLTLGGMEVYYLSECSLIKWEKKTKHCHTRWKWLKSYQSWMSECFCHSNCWEIIAEQLELQKLTHLFAREGLCKSKIIVISLHRKQAGLCVEDWMSLPDTTHISLSFSFVATDLINYPKGNLSYTSAGLICNSLLQIPSRKCTPQTEHLVIVVSLWSKGRLKGSNEAPELSWFYLWKLWGNHDLLRGYDESAKMLLAAPVCIIQQARGRCCCCSQSNYYFPVELDFFPLWGYI